MKLINSPKFLSRALCSILMTTCLQFYAVADYNNPTAEETLDLSKDQEIKQLTEIYKYDLKGTKPRSKMINIMDPRFVTDMERLQQAVGDVEDAIYASSGNNLIYSVGGSKDPITLSLNLSEKNKMQLLLNNKEVRIKNNDSKYLNCYESINLMQSKSSSGSDGNFYFDNSSHDVKPKISHANIIDIKANKVSSSLHSYKSINVVAKEFTGEIDTKAAVIEAPVIQGIIRAPDLTLKGKVFKGELKGGSTTDIKIDAQDTPTSEQAQVFGSNKLFTYSPKNISRDYRALIGFDKSSMPIILINADYAAGNVLPKVIDAHLDVNIGKSKLRTLQVAQTPNSIVRVTDSAVDLFSFDLDKRMEYKKMILRNSYIQLSRHIYLKENLDLDNSVLFCENHNLTASKASINDSTSIHHFSDSYIDVNKSGTNGDGVEIKGKNKMYVIFHESLMDNDTTTVQVLKGNVLNTKASSGGELELDGGSIETGVLDSAPSWELMRNISNYALDFYTAKPVIKKDGIFVICTLDHTKLDKHIGEFSHLSFDSKKDQYKVIAMMGQYKNAFQFTEKSEDIFTSIAGGDDAAVILTDAAQHALFNPVSNITSRQTDSYISQGIGAVAAASRDFDAAKEAMASSSEAGDNLQFKTGITGYFERNWFKSNLVKNKTIDRIGGAIGFAFAKDNIDFGIYALGFHAYGTKSDDVLDKERNDVNGGGGSIFTSYHLNNSAFVQLNLSAMYIKADYHTLFNDSSKMMLTGNYNMKMFDVSLKAANNISWHNFDIVPSISLGYNIAFVPKHTNTLVNSKGTTSKTIDIDEHYKNGIYGSLGGAIKHTSTSGMFYGLELNLQLQNGFAAKQQINTTATAKPTSFKDANSFTASIRGNISVGYQNSGFEGSVSLGGYDDVYTTGKHSMAGINISIKLEQGF